MENKIDVRSSTLHTANGKGELGVRVRIGPNRREPDIIAL